MTDGLDKKRLFRVKLARPVFEIAIVDVVAADHDEARDLARRQAPTLPDHAWIGSFDPVNYGHDVQDLTDSREVDEGDVDPRALEMKAEPDEDVHYALLRADMFGGEGQLLRQPWMLGQATLLITDLAGDWVDELEDIRETNGDKLFEGTFGDDSGDHTPTETQSEPAPAVDQGRSSEPDPKPPLSERPFPSDSSEKVISLSSRRSKQLGTEQFPIKRKYIVDIEVREGDISGFSFHGIALNEDTIEDVTSDVQFVADCLREGRPGILDDEE